jgi:hypothetical protein
MIAYYGSYQRLVDTAKLRRALSDGIGFSWEYDGADDTKGKSTKNYEKNVSETGLTELGNRLIQFQTIR